MKDAKCLVTYLQGQTFCRCCCHSPPPLPLSAQCLLVSKRDSLLHGCTVSVLPGLFHSEGELPAGNTIHRCRRLLCFPQQNLSVSDSSSAAACTIRPSRLAPRLRPPLRLTVTASCTPRAAAKRKSERIVEVNTLPAVTDRSVLSESRR